MKYSLVIIMAVMLFVSAQAWIPFEFETTEDMLEYMRDEDHYIYVIFFYTSSQANHEDGKKMYDIVMKERQLIKENILDKYDNIVYAELNLAEGKYDDVANQIGIETSDADEYPIVVAVDDGVGKWVHGPNLVQLMVPVIEALSARNK